MLRYLHNTLNINNDCRYDEVILITYLVNGERNSDWVKNYWVNDKVVKEMA